MTIETEWLRQVLYPTIFGILVSTAATLTCVSLEASAI